MVRRKLFWTCSVVVGIVAAVGLLFALFAEHRVSITASEIQSRIDAALPKTVKGVTVTEVKVALGDKALAIRAVVHGEHLGQSYDLTAKFVGNPRYKPQEGAFYFRPEQVVIEQFAFRGKSPAETVEKLAERYITNPGLRNLATDVAPKIEGWMMVAAEKAVATTFEHAPVYRLKDDVKSTLIRASLAGVVVTEQNVVVTFSLMALTMFVLMWGLALLAALGMVVALVMFPELGAVLLVTAIGS